MGQTHLCCCWWKITCPTRTYSCQKLQKTNNNSAVFVYVCVKVFSDGLRPESTLAGSLSMGPSHAACCQTTHSADEPRPGEPACTHLQVPSTAFRLPAWFSVFFQSKFYVVCTGEHGDRMVSTSRMSARLSWPFKTYYWSKSLCLQSLATLIFPSAVLVLQSEECYTDRRGIFLFVPDVNYKQSGRLVGLLKVSVCPGNTLPFCTLL